MSAEGPRRAIATVCLSGTLEDKIAAAAAAGFDGNEVFEPDLVASPWRVFFEVVQRLGGYDGYGTADAPVRMAAHRRRRQAATR